LLGNAQFDRHTIAQIAVSPTNPNLVYVAVHGGGANGVSGNTGIWKSNDGGLNWTNTTTAISTTAAYTDLVISSGDLTGNTLYAAVGSEFGSAANGIYKTQDGGGVWNLLSGFPSGMVDGRIRLAVGRGFFG